MTKHTTIARRIEEMLSLYEALNDEATRWLISTIEEIAAPRCPGIPKGVVRMLEIDNRFAGTLNYPEILRYLRQARV